MLDAVVGFVERCNHLREYGKVTAIYHLPVVSSMIRILTPTTSARERETNGPMPTITLSLRSTARQSIKTFTMHCDWQSAGPWPIAINSSPSHAQISNASRTMMSSRPRHRTLGGGRTGASTAGLRLSSWISNATLQQFNACRSHPHHACP